MMRSLHGLPAAAAVVSLAWAVVLSAAAPGPVPLSPAEKAALVRELEKDRADTEQWLKSDITSYLATVDRRDFEQRTTLTVGRAPDNDVRVDDAAFTAAPPANHRRRRPFPRGRRRQCRALHGRQAGQPLGRREPVGDHGRSLPASALAPALSGHHRLRSAEPALQGIQGSEVLPAQPRSALRAAADGQSVSRDAS